MRVFSADGDRHTINNECHPARYVRGGVIRGAVKNLRHILQFVKDPAPRHVEHQSATSIRNISPQHQSATSVNDCTALGGESGVDLRSAIAIKVKQCAGVVTAPVEIALRYHEFIIGGLGSSEHLPRRSENR